MNTTHNNNIIKAITKHEQITCEYCIYSHQNQYRELTCNINGLCSPTPIDARCQHGAWVIQNNQGYYAYNVIVAIMGLMPHITVNDFPEPNKDEYGRVIVDTNNRSVND